MHPALGLENAEKKQRKVWFTKEKLRDLNNHSLMKQQVWPHGSHVQAQHLKKKTIQSIKCILQLYRPGNTAEDFSLFHFWFKNSYKAKLQMEAVTASSRQHSHLPAHCFSAPRLCPARANQSFISVQVQPCTALFRSPTKQSQLTPFQCLWLKASESVPGYI